LENSNTFASVGRPLEGGLEIKIVPVGDETESNPDEGLVYLKGSVIFKGYHNNESATASALTEDGWMNSGDIGTLDQNGNLRLLGRQKEVLILNGNNYSSFEIEYALETGNIAGITTSYTAVFSTWNESASSEAVVVLFNPTEAAIGPKNMRGTLQAIDKSIFSICAQKALRIIPLPKNLLPKSTPRVRSLQCPHKSGQSLSGAERVNPATSQAMLRLWPFSCCSPR
jgi:acyl-CoA synthetase (AMP-forming)/AMP-acid ligase II